jgi:hypothetical protein
MSDQAAIAQFHFLRDEESLLAFYRAFQDRTLWQREWSHAAHVCVAACTIIESPQDAVDLLRERIRRYNEAVGTLNTPDAGYHETLTVFWTETIRRHLSKLEAGTPFLEAVRSAVLEFAPKSNMYQRYYSYDILRSREARAKWVEPDLIEFRV